MADDGRLGRRYNRAKKGVGKPAGTILAQSEPISTAEQLAAEHGVSPATVYQRDPGGFYGVYELRYPPTQ